MIRKRMPRKRTWLPFRYANGLCKNRGFAPAAVSPAPKTGTVFESKSFSQGILLNTSAAFLAAGTVDAQGYCYFFGSLTPIISGASNIS